MTPSQVRKIVDEALKSYFKNFDLADTVTAAVRSGLPAIPPSNAAEIAKLKEEVANLSSALAGKLDVIIKQQEEAAGSVQNPMLTDSAELGDPTGSAPVTPPPAQ